MQRQNFDTANLHDVLYGNLSNRSQAAFNYLTLPPPPPNVGPAQPVVPATTPASIASKLVTLTNLHNQYMNSPAMAHLAPDILNRITLLHNQLNQAE
jgi:hypothetical protein